MMTNTSAMIALQTLRQINESLDTTSTRVSTGLRIANASDSPAYWSIATETRSDNGALSVVRDALSLGEATASVTAAGLEGVRDGLERVRNLLISARAPGVDRAAIQTEISGLLSDIQGTAQSATVNGQNLLSVDSSATDYNQTASVVGAFERTGSGVSISTIDLSVDNIKLIDPAGGTAAGILDQDRTAGGTTSAVTAVDVSTLTDASADMTTLDEFIQITDAALSDVIDAETEVGSAQFRIEAQMDFVGALMDANDRAVGALVDADMEAESSRLRALQTQQQLAVQALSVSNASMSNVLALFR
jgi:flagellin